MSSAPENEETVRDFLETSARFFGVAGLDQSTEKGSSMTGRTVSSAAAAGLLVAAVAVVLAGCQQANSQPHGSMPPPVVAVVKVEPQPVAATFEYVGQTAGSREVEVRARVSGILLKRNYREGGTVREGQSMFVVDPAPFEVAAARAEAALASAEAKLAQAKRNSARLKPLYEVRAASQKDYDEAVSVEQVAEAEVKSARANVADAQLNLRYTRVEAPVTGIAGRAQRSEGNYVSGAEALLTTVSQIDPIYVLFGVSDEERLRLTRQVEAGQLSLPKDGQFDVTLKLADGSVYSKSGKVNFSDVRVSGQTGTSEARAELPNPTGLLHPGQFVRVTLKGAERPAAVLVPQRAVLEGPKGKFVYVVNEKNQAEPRPVSLGDWQGDAWIVTSGLAAGDRVIVDGVMKIGPGAPVTVATQAPQGAEPAKNDVPERRPGSTVAQK
jgi:membrane fusion protein (multidrug efflux system)